MGWGRNTFIGYLNRENDTKEVFVPSNEEGDKENAEAATSSDKQNWLKLKDLGFIDDDGFLVVLGKPDDFITLNTREIICPTKVNMIIKSYQIGTNQNFHVSAKITITFNFTPLNISD